MFNVLKRVSPVFGSKAGGVEYDFKTLNPVDFECVILVPIQRGAVSFIFEQSKKYVKARGLVSGEVLKDVVAVDPKYFKLLETGLSSVSRSIFEEVAKDGVRVYKSSICEASFCKGDASWKINIKVVGEYARS